MRPHFRNWQELRAAVFERDNYTCVWCGAKGGRLHADHIYPFSRGGKNTYANVVTSCETCNLQKSASVIPDEWIPLAQCSECGTWAHPRGEAWMHVQGPMWVCRNCMNEIERGIVLRRRTAEALEAMLVLESSEISDVDIEAYEWEKLEAEADDTSVWSRESARLRHAGEWDRQNRIAYLSARQSVPD